MPWEKNLLRMTLVTTLAVLLGSFCLGMGYKVEDLVPCTPPVGENATAQFIQTECPTWRIFGCEDQLAIPMTDLSEYGECRLHVYSGFDPIIATINTPNGPPVPLDRHNFTAKAGRHSQEVCTQWFPVEENGGKFEVLVSNYGPAGQYSYKIIIECLREKPTGEGTPSVMHEGIVIPEFTPRIDLSNIGKRKEE